MQNNKLFRNFTNQYNMSIKVEGLVSFKDTADTYEYKFNTMQEAMDYHRASLITMAETIADYDGGFQSTIYDGPLVVQQNSIKTTARKVDYDKHTKA